LFFRFSFHSRRETLARLLERAQAMAEEAGTGSAGDADGAHVLRDVRRALGLARVFDYRSRPDCLPRALAAFVVLRQSGLPAALRVGARKFPFAAHAWVEVDGESVTDRDHERGLYHPMLTIS
jgi:hypothetical protein